MPLAPPPVPRPYFGPPITPPVVVRARLLLLVTSFLTAVNVGIIYYIVQVEYTPAEETNPAAAFTAQIIAFLVTTAPLSVVPTVLSVFIGRGHDWARVSTAAFVVLQAVCCTICGPVLPFSQPTETESGSFAPGGYLAMGIVTLAIGLVSVAIAIMLLSPGSNAYFSAMAQWRQRAPGPGRPPAYR